MNITVKYETTPWLLLVFTLPSSRASERVGVWRKLQKFGSIPFRNAGYVLPNEAISQERFEWLAASVRSSEGEASILQVQSIDDTPIRVLQEQFRQARAVDYEALIEDAGKLKSSANGKSVPVVRLRRRYEEIAAIDFFESPLRRQADEALKRLEQPDQPAKQQKTKRANKAAYKKRVWITRPRPGIDRASSAWLIERFIDPKARFIFGTDPVAHPKAVPFDMFQGVGFGHEGEQCTFETLCIAFELSDPKVRLIAQAIHDADIEDDKYGRSEGHTMNQILKGWAKQNIPDKDLLRRGIDLIAGLYEAIQ
jgi:hypothetical protein